MKKFAITHATMNTLIENSALREASPAIKQAYEAVNRQEPGATCSACAKRRKTNDAAVKLIADLTAASDLELDRLKKILNIDTFVFSSGLSFTER